MTVRALAVMSSLLASHGVFAEVTPRPGNGDVRIRTVAYAPEEIYRLQGFVGYALELEFEAGEAFTGEAGGDLEAITFAEHDNHVILKPRAVTNGTNLILYTNRRVYRCLYSALDRAPHSAHELVLAVRFTYPAPEPQSPTTVQEVLQPLVIDDAVRYWNVHYAFCGAHSLKPLDVMDDGVHTHVLFAATTELPAIFMRDLDGTESLVNFSVQTHELIVHRVAPRLILRRGKTTACIVNLDYRGSGARLEQQSLLPGLRREAAIAP